jgi:hypothetical protein
MIWRAFSKKKTYCLVSWKQICTSYEQGGLDIINLKLMNKALLCKWLWKYHNSEHKGLWKDIIRCRYHNRRTLINASSFWK